MAAKLGVTRRDLASSPADLRVLFVAEGEKITGLDPDAQAVAAAEAARRDFKARAAACLETEMGDAKHRRTVLVVGLGPRAKITPEDLRRAAATAMRKAVARRPRAIAVGLPELTGHTPEPLAASIAEGLLLGAYRFERYLRDPERLARTVPPVTLHAGESERAAAAGVQRATTVADAIALARDLVNTAPSDLHPETFEDLARATARAEGLTIRVLREAQLERERMRAMLAVGRGGSSAPRLIHLAYKGGGRAAERLAIVGKGLTFDAGGYNIKSTGSIEDMKSDMAGAAAALGAIVAIARLGVRADIHVFLAVAENLVSSRAFKPGDVLETRAGKTVEINNTDAEGRLVLADALDYARTAAKPQAMVDLATLTGSCVVALGPLSAGLFSNDDALAARVAAAAARAGERVWRMPLYADYFEQMDSDIADFKNTGQRYGGAITAGLFLEKFAGGVPWAHLDIAGPAWSEHDHAFFGKGGTGMGVGTLVELVRQTA